MAKNYDGLVKGTFPSTTEAAGGAPFALAEVIRGGGTVVVKNDSDRDLLDARVLDNRMIIWHDSDSEYQYYDASGLTRDGTGALAGGPWKKLQLGAEAGYGIDTDTDANGNLIFNVDTDLIADTEWVKNQIVNLTKIGDVSNVNDRVNNPGGDLIGESKQHFLWDNTANEWTASREVIDLDSIASVDSEVAAGLVNDTNRSAVFDLNQFKNISLDTDAIPGIDSFFTYDTESREIILNTHIGMRVVVNLAGISALYKAIAGTNGAANILFQYKQPNETEFTNAFTSSTNIVTAALDTIFTAADTELVLDVQDQTRFRLTVNFPFLFNTSANMFLNPGSTIALSGFFGQASAFASSEVDRRAETKNSFVIYHESSVDTLDDRWVATRLIEDFTTSGVLAAGLDTDAVFAAGHGGTVQDAIAGQPIQLHYPVKFTTGLESCNVLVWRPELTAFEYVGAIDTDISFTTNAYNFHINDLIRYGSISSAMSIFFILEYSNNKGSTWTQLAKTNAIDYPDDNSNVIDTDYTFNAISGTQKMLNGGLIRVSFVARQEIFNANNRFTLTGYTDAAATLGATGSYHILTGGFASQEYVDSQIGLLDAKRTDSDNDIITAYEKADSDIIVAYTKADSDIIDAYKAADIALDSEIKAYANDITFDFVGLGSWNWTGNVVSNNVPGSAFFTVTGSTIFLFINSTDANGNIITVADLDSEYFQIGNSIVRRATNAANFFGTFQFQVTTVLNPLANLADGTYTISSSDHIQTYTAGLGLTLDTENVFRVDTEAIADTEWVKARIAEQAHVDTTYTAGLGLNLTGTAFSVDTEVIADTDYVKQYVADHANVGHADSGGLGINIDQTDVTNTIFSVDTDVIATRTYAEEQDAFRGLSGLILGNSIHKNYGNDNFRPFTVNTDIIADPTENQVIVNELSNQYVLTVRREDLSKKGLAPSADILQINTANNADYSAYKVLDIRSNDGTHYVYSLSKYTIDGRTDRLDTIVNGATINITHSSANALSLDLVPAAEANVDFNGNAITNIVNGTTDSDVVNKGYVDNFGIQDKTYIIFFSGIEQNSPVNNNEVSVGDLVNDLRFVEFADTSIDLTLSSYYGIRTGTNIGYYFLDHVLHNPNGLTRNDGYFRFLVGTDTLATVEDSDAIIFARAAEVHPTQYNTFTTGSSGLVPGPVAADVTNNRILRADGSWIDDVDNDTHYAAGLGLTEFNEIYAVDQSFVATVDYVNGKIANNNLVFNSASPNAISDVLDTDDHVVASLPNINDTMIHLQSGPKSGIEYFPLARTLGQINFTGDTDTFTDILKPDVFGTVDSAAIRWDGSPSDVIIDTDHSFSMRLAAVNGNSSTDIDTTAFTIQLVLKVFSGNDGDYTDGGSTIYGITHTVAPFQVQPLDTENIDFDFNIKQILDSNSHNKISNTQVIVPYFIVDYGTEVNWSLISGQSITLTPGHDATKRSLRFGVHHPRVISSLSIDTDTGLNITDSDGNIVSFYDGATKQINRDVRFPWVRGWTFGVDYFVNDLVRAGSKFYECNIAHNSNSSNEPGLSNLGHWVDLSGVKSIAILPDEGLDIFRNDSTGEVDLFLDSDYVKGLIPTELDQSNPKLLLSLLEGSSKTDYVRDAANNNRVTSIGLSTYLEDTATDYRQFFNYNVAGDVTSIEWYDSSSLTKVPANLKITKTFTYNTDGDVTSAIVS